MTRLSGLIRNTKAFTLVEVVIILPIAAIITTSLMVILFSQYGSVLAESSRSNLRVEGQSLLIGLQDELLFTMEFGHELNPDLEDDYAPTGGWRYDSTPQALIINEVALDSARSNQQRSVIRRELSPCSLSASSNNPVAINNIVYFIEDIQGSRFKRLVKRVITPQYSVCGTDSVTGESCSPPSSTCKDNAKLSTCPEAGVGIGGCVREDYVLSENVLGFSIEYYAINNTVTAFPSGANRVEITIIMGDNIFGREVEVEVAHSVRKVN